MTDPADDFRPSVARARAILKHQVAGTPVGQVDARIAELRRQGLHVRAELRRQGLHVRAENLLRARIAAHGEPIGLQSAYPELKKDA